VNENLSDFFGGLSNRTLTVRTPKGHPLLHLRLLHAAGAAAAGVFLAPRITAVAAMGLLVKGFSLSIDVTPEPRG
jgi:hypothetical protein